jgi:hypothetical protein
VRVFKFACFASAGLLVLCAAWFGFILLDLSQATGPENSTEAVKVLGPILFAAVGPPLIWVGCLVAYAVDSYRRGLAEANRQ